MTDEPELITDETIESIRGTFDCPNRNGQTAAFCAQCGEEIKGVAYIVQVRDVARLLIEPIGSTILHYNCIAAMYKPNREDSRESI